MTRVARITVYPIKSLDGAHTPRASLLRSGALEHDRRYALIDAAGSYVNGKRCADVHRVRAGFAFDPPRVTLAAPGRAEASFSLPAERAGAGRWLSDALGRECALQENAGGGFPDDHDAPGPTFISTQTIEAVADWFNLSADECRRRFRANVELNAPAPFWEDQLAGATFRVGPTTFNGTGVCQRCVVPTRDSHTGEAIQAFQKRFAAERERTLPVSSPRNAFNHFYRLAVNTRLIGDARPLSVGDAVMVVP